MQTIHVTTRIAAPAMRVFLLSLSVDLHTESTKQTEERAVAGVTHGLMRMGDRVTWKARHFGVMLTHTSEITQYKPPHHFEDVMIAGMFKSFAHFHRFEPDASGTVMTDELTFASPLGPLGAVADWLVLRRYLTGFLERRNRLILQVAESESWQAFIPPDLQTACQ